MAKSKSTSANTPPSTAQGTLSAFQQDLFKILDGLQTQITTDAANESTALNSFIQAESTLVAKSTDFGGPSPYFVSPTWKGSSKPNGAKSYETAFKPIITAVLSQKTANQDEQTINLEELSVNLLNVFKNVFNRLGITEGMTADNQSTSIKWVQDSIFESSTYISVMDQEGLANQMTDAILGKTDIASEGAFDKNKNSYGPWATKQINKYFKSQKGQGTDIDHVANQILDLLKNSLSKYNQSDEDSIRDWVQTTISTAPSSIPVTNLQKEELVGALEQEVTKLFPQPDASFFYSNLQTILLQNIYNPPQSTVMAAKAANSASSPKNLNLQIQQVINSTDSKGSITAIASGGKAGATYQFTWTDESGNSVTPSDKSTATTSVIDNLAPGKYKVEVSDGVNTYPPSSDGPLEVEVFNSDLTVVETDYKNVSLNGGNDGLLTVKASGGSPAYKFSWINVSDSDAKITGRTDSLGTSSTIRNLTAGTYQVTVSDAASPAAQTVLLLNVTEPAYSAGNGIKFLIDTIMGVQDNPQAPVQNKKIAAQLESTIKKMIEIAIDKTFSDMAEYGAQGRLMSSTYDYQLISRISGYTTALVDELKTDYNTYIPTNSSNALHAAQEITAAAVAFREFATALPAVTDAFKSELNHNPSGNTANSTMISNNYTQIKNLIENDPNTSLTDLSKLADAIYISTNKSKVPLIKIAELNGVTLASSTAGLNTSLSKLLTGEQSSALNSLAQMKANAKSNFEAAYKDLNTKATAYFTEMDDYINAKQDFNYDMLKLDAINNALNTLSQVIGTGISHQGFTDVYAKT